MVDHTVWTGSAHTQEQWTNWLEMWQYFREWASTLIFAYSTHTGLCFSFLTKIILNNLNYQIVFDVENIRIFHSHSNIWCSIVKKKCHLWILLCSLCFRLDSNIFTYKFCFVVGPVKCWTILVCFLLFYCELFLSIFGRD